MTPLDGKRFERRRRLLAGVGALPLASSLSACGVRLTSPERGPFVVLMPQPDIDADRIKRLANGVDRARRESQAQFRVVENVPREREALLKSLRTAADSDAKMVVGFGAAMSAPMQRVAWEFPEQRFTLVDGSLEALRPNVALYELLEPQAWFLAGMLAGLVTKSQVVGVTARADRDLADAYAAGLKATNTQARLVLARAVTLGDAIAAVNAQAAAKADVAMIAEAPWTEAAVDEARARGVRLIGEGRDWITARPDAFIASVVDEPGDAVVAAFRDLRDAVWRGDIVRRFGVRSGAIGLSLAKDLPSSLRTTMDGNRDQVAAGRFDIPGLLPAQRPLSGK